MTEASLRRTERASGWRYLQTDDFQRYLRVLIRMTASERVGHCKVPIPSQCCLQGVVEHGNMMTLAAIILSTMMFSSIDIVHLELM